MSKKSRGKRPQSQRLASGAPVPTELRIIGGKLRGSKLSYSGDPRVRPMKDRVREAIFNLVGPAVKGLHAIDLFAGTGALGLEAISRGATAATFIEQHFPTAAVLRKNVEHLNLEDRTQINTGDTLLWYRLQPKLPPDPWLVFVSPPYVLFIDRQQDMLSLINFILENAPPGSMIVVESDARFDHGLLPKAEEWDVREYPPARVGLLRVSSEE